LHFFIAQVKQKGQTLGCIFLQQEQEGHIELLQKGSLQHSHVLQGAQIYELFASKYIEKKYQADQFY
jgi:hypothetical protein